MSKHKDERAMLTWSAEGGYACSLCGLNLQNKGCRHWDEFYGRSVAAPAPDGMMVEGAPAGTARDAALEALRQWEQDTEAPASAPEGNAFIDGFNARNAEVAQLRKEIELKQKLVDADTIVLRERKERFEESNGQDTLA